MKSTTASVAKQVNCYFALGSYIRKPSVYLGSRQVLNFSLRGGFAAIYSVASLTDNYRTVRKVVSQIVLKTAGCP